MQKKIIKVPYIDQTKEWPTGCESVSAVMLLQYLGIDISVKQFVEQYLVREPFFERCGKLYGPDPWKAFAGDPADERSMGCYAPVICSALEKVFKQTAEGSAEVKSAGQKDTCGRKIQEKSERGKPENAGWADKRCSGGWEAVDLTDVPMGELLHEYIDQDIPVIFWASIDLKATYSGPEWILTDTGEIFTWRSNEHCMLLVGYDEKSYYFNDPWHGHGTIAYEKELVEKRHAEQYRMAVSIKNRGTWDD